MRIYLVRHGQSASNVDSTVHHRVADHAIPLSEEGIAQAHEAGKYLAERFLQRSNRDGNGNYATRLWVSPYRRTRQTADAIEEEFRKTSSGFAFGRREHINLCEQQFGLFDGYDDEDRAEKFPVEYAHYKKCVDDGGEFWARLPMGESRFDVAVRVHQAFGTFKRDEERHHIRNLIVVCHGATMRAFIMQWLHHPFEWFENERNPNNCAVRLIDDDMDHEYVFEGFPKPGKR